MTPAHGIADRCRPRVGTRPRRIAVGLFNLLLIPAAYATTQCPPEAGHKPEWIGWLAVALLGGGLIAGPPLAWWVFARSKGARLGWRVVTAFAGLLLMLGLWAGCGALAGHLILSC